MGIPHLTALLEPYAVHAGLEDTKIVVDGPALAYHVLAICRRNGVNQPSYELLGRTAIEWLGRLEAQKNTIDAVYFDGYLPDHKLPVRMERQMKTLSQLTLFASSYPGGCSDQNISSERNEKLELFTNHQPDKKQLSPPAFLVPSIIEALKGSKYSSRVQVVQGEADAFCAKHVAQAGGVVLTSDSDLLVHNIGSGRVVFFRDIYAQSNKQLHFAVYEPTSICQRLGLPEQDGLQRLGFELLLSKDSTMGQLSRRCMQPVVDEEGYRLFSEEYNAEAGHGPNLPFGGKVRLDSLDPRVSELVLQFTRSDASSNHGTKLARMFLPILIENPTRGTCWEPTTPIRQLAYALLAASLSCSNITVQEHRRVQNLNQKGKAVESLHKSTVAELATDLISCISHLKQLVKASENLFWVLLGLILDIRNCQAQGKQSLSLSILELPASAIPKAGSKVPWDIVHFVAHIQAAHYSLRMVKQIIDFVPMDRRANLPKEVTALWDQLQTLPKLAKYPDINKLLKMLENAGKLKLMDVLGEFVEVTPRSFPTGSEVGEKRKRQSSSKSRSKDRTKRSNTFGGNMFDVLDNE